MVVNLQIASVLINGLQQGSIYILLAVGLSIILGTLRFVNFAHGALYLIGAYLGLFIAQRPRLTNGKLAEWLSDGWLAGILGPASGTPEFGLGLGFFAALIIVPIFVFGVGVVMERVVAKPFYDRPDTDQILITFGIALVIQELFRVLFGGNSQSIAAPPIAQGAVPIEGLALSWWRVWIVAITAVLVLLVYLLIEFTDFGLVVRAGTVDPEMVELLGIRLSRPYIVVFGIGAALAGVAGIVGGPLSPFNPSSGTGILVPAFITVVIGGVGDIRGAVLGGLLIGLTQASLVQFGFPEWSQVGIYALAAIVLLVRPQGLLGKEVDVA